MRADACCSCRPLMGISDGACLEGPSIQAKRFTTVVRECKEELSCDVQVKYLSGIYYHAHLAVHVAIFRCSLSIGAEVRLSSEHSQFRYVPISELTDIQRKRVEDCL